MDQTIASVRSFNRFYTRFIGALDAEFLGSEATLAEARILFEIGQGEAVDGGTLTASTLQNLLAMDAGYVSRILARFEARGWISRGRGAADARSRPIVLSPEGRSVLDEIDARQRGVIALMLEPLGAVGQADLLAALRTVRALLDPAPAGAVAIRTFGSGDMGAIASRQSKLYAESHSWGRELEVIAGDVTAAFLRGFKPGREQCWVAEVDGVMAGSVFLTDEGADLGRLRLLYVEPFARGRGVGDALVGTCVAFARDAGFTAVTLWTHTVLETARRLYARHGFGIIETAVHTAFGSPLQGETWRLDLGREPVGRTEAG